METIIFDKDIIAFGKRVKAFPMGVPETFDELLQMLGGFNRSFYGISYLDDRGQMVYIAAAEQLQEGEAEKYQLEKLVIEKGEYLSLALRDWRPKTVCIKDLFHELINDKRTDSTKPGVEWYKSEEEMLCMIKTRKEKELQDAVKR